MTLTKQQVVLLAVAAAVLAFVISLSQYGLHEKALALPLIAGAVVVFFGSSLIRSEERTYIPTELERRAERYIFKELQKLDTDVQEVLGVSLATPDAPTHFSLPEEKRTQHTVIVAASGHGKTQLLQSLILDDLDKDATVIVIDSQGQLIKNLVNVVPANRLCHLTPTDQDYPLALNLFDAKNDASLYEYIFNALDTGLTGTQTSLFRYVSRLCQVIPGGNLSTMYEILQKDGHLKYEEYIKKLPPRHQTFFEKSYDNNKEYRDTRQAVLRRLDALLENDTFTAMFDAPSMKLNMEREILDGKVILIDTAKRVLSGTAFKVFGRFFIAQIAKTIFNREHPFKKRVYLYIDEFADYAGEEEFIEELFSQSRKLNVALTVSFQYIDQLPDTLRHAIFSNTGTKIAGEMSAAGRSAMAREFQLKPDLYQSLPKGAFYCRHSGSHTYRFDVTFGRLENLDSRSKTELNSIRDLMRQKYSVGVDDKPVEEEPKPNFNMRDPFDERN